MATGGDLVARPLSVLVPLIKEDLKQAEKAGLPYWQAAGWKLLEAKSQVDRGAWGAWLKRNFELSATTARIYMNFATTIGAQKEGIPFSSLNDFHRQTGSSAYRSVTSRRAWHEGVKESIDHAKREAERAQRENRTRQQEREADQRLALRLIEIGFKVLPKELHPAGDDELLVHARRRHDLPERRRRLTGHGGAHALGRTRSGVDPEAVEQVLKPCRVATGQHGEAFQAEQREHFVDGGVASGDAACGIIVSLQYGEAECSGCNLRWRHRSARLGKSWQGCLRRFDTGQIVSRPGAARAATGPI